MSRFINIHCGINLPCNLYGFYGVMTFFSKDELLVFEEKNKDIINKIEDKHREISNPERLDKAIWIGEMLVKQKKELAHGDFVNFVKRNFSFSERTSRNYMRLYKNKDKIKQSKIKTLRQAYELVLEVKR